MRWGGLFLMGLGCTGASDDSPTTLELSDSTDTGSPSDPRETGTNPAPGGSARVVDVTITSNPGLILEVVIDIELTESAAVAVACTREDATSEVHLGESTMASASHQLRLGGLVAETTYNCVVAPLDVEKPAPFQTSFTTEPLPGRIPSVTTEGDRAALVDGPYTLFTHQRLWAGEENMRLVVIDPDGVVRWYYRVPTTGSLDMGAEHIGNGLFLWGGVSASPRGEGRPRTITASHETTWIANYPESNDLLFHHSAEQQPDGSILALVEYDATAPGGRGFVGFGLHRIDPAKDALVWSWDAQTAIDARQLSTDDVEDYGANWAGPLNDGVRDAIVVSLCDVERAIGLDPVTGDVVWSIGSDASLNLVDGDEWVRCSHGSDSTTGRLLMYDNGGFDDAESRLVEYVIDAKAGTATETWTWTEAGWNEPIWGDVDVLSNDHVLIARGHSGLSPNDDDVSQLVELDRKTETVVWRARLGIPVDGVYNADRFDDCESFANARFCPAVRNRLDALSNWF